MKIFHIPPEYLDNDTLIQELRLTRYLFDKIIAKNNNIFRKPSGRLVEMYKNNHAFILIRNEVILNELVSRKIRVDGEGLVKSINKLVDDQADFPFELEDVDRDCRIITDIWEEYFQEDVMIQGYLEKLSLTNPEELYHELNELYQTIKEEYEL
jgi:hypothetical protein